MTQKPELRIAHHLECFVPSQIAWALRQPSIEPQRTALKTGLHGGAERLVLSMRVVRQYSPHMMHVMPPAGITACRRLAGAMQRTTCWPRTRAASCSTRSTSTTGTPTGSAVTGADMHLLPKQTSITGCWGAQEPVTVWHRCSGTNLLPNSGSDLD